MRKVNLNLCDLLSLNCFNSSGFRRIPKSMREYSWLPTKLATHKFSNELPVNCGLPQLSTINRILTICLICFEAGYYSHCTSFIVCGIPLLLFFFFLILKYFEFLQIKVRNFTLVQSMEQARLKMFQK